MKKIWIMFIVLLVLITGFALAKNVIAQLAIINGVKKITGLDLEVRGVNVGIVKTFLSLNDLKILNPGGFSEKVMADFPEIYAYYNFGDFFKGKAHFEELRLNLKELIVLKNERNQVNIESLKALLPQTRGEHLQFQIDNLNLKIDKIIYKDFAAGKPQTREFNINVNENFKNINDPKSLVNLILVRALSKTNIPSLADINLTELKQQASKALSGQAESVVGELKEKAAETLKKILEPQQ